MIKKISIGVVFILVVLMIWNFDLLVYGVKQAKGQFNIVWNARPVQEYLSDPAVPDSVKNKLRYIETVRKYAIDELGLNNTDNYTSMYDQKGKPLLWVVTGCKPYAFEPKEWKFPVVGKMPYKGFFVEEDAIKTKERLQEEGYDAGIRTVGGWSTLGWFNDPILSNMLARSTGDLANLIIHELVHATIFVKDSVDFNENLASFIGDEGARQFLRDQYGPDSEEYTTYLQEVEDEKNYVAHVLRGADSLDVLYKSFHEGMPEEDKELYKQQLIGKIMQELDTVTLNDLNFLKNVKGYQPDNTFFMSFMRYRSKQSNLDTIYNDFHGDLPAFILHLKKKHPFL